jgi:hypothetical protein
MATLAEKKEMFVKMFGADPDIAKLPLPDSIRERLGVFQDISYKPMQQAVNQALFSGNRYDAMEVRENDPKMEFPDLSKFKTNDG